MKSVYLETTAFFKVFVEDTGNQYAERLILLAKEGKVRLVLSDWVINETIAKIEENLRSRTITIQETQAILSEITEMIRGRVQYSHFTFYAIDERVIIESRVTIQDLDLNAAEALHVYVAHQSGCDAFISARPDLVDRLFDAKIRGEGNLVLDAFNVEDKKDMERFFTLIP